MRTVQFDIKLPEGANPTEWVQLKLELVCYHRYFDCKNYNDCIHFASSNAWGGFTCVFCDLWPVERRKYVRRRIERK